MNRIRCLWFSIKPYLIIETYYLQSFVHLSMIKDKVYKFLFLLLDLPFNKTMTTIIGCICNKAKILLILKTCNINPEREIMVAYFCLQHAAYISCQHRVYLCEHANSLYRRAAYLCWHATWFKYRSFINKMTLRVDKFLSHATIILLNMGKISRMCT